MKMLKKLLAVVLTGAMALTLFTACGSNAVRDKDIADALNNIVKLNDSEVTFTPRAKEREMAQKLAALLESHSEDDSNSAELSAKIQGILGIDQGGANANNFVWCGATYTDELGTSGQALNFMTQVMDKSANADKLRGKNPADDRYMGTALYKTVDENGKQVTKRIIVVTAEAVDE